MTTTMQSVNVELPDDIYRRLQGMAAMTRRSLEDVIFQTIRGNLPPAPDDLSPEQRDIVVPLQGLGDDALWAVATEPLPAQTWRRHRRLLGKAQAATLAPAEQVELARLRAATDRFVLRRSYALALLKWRGYTVPPA